MCICFWKVIYAHADVRICMFIKSTDLVTISNNFVIALRVVFVVVFAVVAAVVTLVDKLVEHEL